MPAYSITAAEEVQGGTKLTLSLPAGAAAGQAAAAAAAAAPELPADLKGLKAQRSVVLTQGLPQGCDGYFGPQAAQ